jgi:hypothetical protein
MTVSSEKSLINSNGMISQRSHDMSSMKWKNYDVQGDEKYFPSAYF